MSTKGKKEEEKTHRSLTGYTIQNFETEKGNHYLGTKFP